MTVKGYRFLLETQKLTAMMVAQLCKLYLSKPASNHIEPFLARGGPYRSRWWDSICSPAVGYGGVLRVAVMVWGGICCQLSTFLSLSREQQNLGVVRRKAVGSMSVEKVPRKKVCSECGVLVRL